MSAKLMGNVFDLELSHEDQIVLLALADHANDDGYNVYPSQGKLAWKTGYSDRQIRRILTNLIERGFLEQVGKTDKGTHVFKLDLSAGTPKPPYRFISRKAGEPVNTPDEGVGHYDPPDTAMSHPVGHSYDPPGWDIAVSHKPSEEPSIEPPNTPQTSSAVPTTKKATRRGKTPASPSRTSAPPKPRGATNTQAWMGDHICATFKLGALNDQFGAAGTPSRNQVFGALGKLTKAGITPTLFPYWLILWKRENRGYLATRGFTWWDLCNGINNRPSLADRVLLEYADREGKPSPWNPAFYVKDKEYMTWQYLYRLCEQEVRQPDKHWAANRHKFVPGAEPPPVEVFVPSLPPWRKERRA